MTASEPTAAVLTERPHPLTPLIRGWVVLLAIVIAIGRELIPDGSGDNGLSRLPVELVLAGVALICLAAGLAGFLSWRFTRFVIDEEQIRIDTGWLFRSSQRIAFERIQSVDLRAPLAARVVGLSELTIDLGGETSTLRYLSAGRARQIRDLLLRRAHERNEDEPATPQAPSTPWAQAEPPSEVLVQIPPATLIFAVVTSHEFLLLVAALAAIGVATLIAGPGWAVLALALPAASGLIGMIGRRVVAQFNYRLVSQQGGLRISRGLTTITSQALPGRRVQSVRVTQSLLWRRLDLYRVDLNVLGWGPLTDDEDSSQVSTILLPAASGAQVRIALMALWPSLEGDLLSPQLTAPSRARWLRPFSAHFLRWGVDDQLLATRQGLLVRRWSYVPHARTQSVALRQGPGSRRLGLAHLDLHTAGMAFTVSVPGVEARQAAAALSELAVRIRTRRTPDLADRAARWRPGQTAGPEERLADQAEETISSSE